MQYEQPGQVERDWSDAISPIEEIIEDARNGRMFVLVDHEDRENEGDLVIPAQMATPDAINFMATHGRGLILPAPRGWRALPGIWGREKRARPRRSALPLRQRRVGAVRAGLASRPFPRRALSPALFLR